jgi:hypothetical protein
VSVDNEHLRRGFLDYDLARAWYRWGLPAVAQQRFENSYHRQWRPAPPPEERRAWRTAAALGALHMRYRRGAPRQAPCAALHAVLAGGGR